MAKNIETARAELSRLAEEASGIETQIKELSRQLLEKKGEITAKQGEAAEFIIAQMSFAAPGPVVRTYFVTPHHVTDYERMASGLKELGAVAFEPARRLPVGRVWTEWRGPIALPPHIIFRVDFANEVRRKEVERVRGVNKVRVSLATAPAGQDLPAALRPLPPPAPPVAKTPADPNSRNSRKKWPRLEVKAMKEEDLAVIRQAFEIIGLPRPEDWWPQSERGEWARGDWRLESFNSSRWRCDLRISCRDLDELDRLVGAVPGAKRVR